MIRDTIYQVALKAEAAEGVKETLAAADVINATNARFTPDVKMNPSNLAQGTMSPTPARPGLRSAKISFDVLLRGNKAGPGSPPDFSAAMRCSGWDETVTASTSVAYSPAKQSTVIPSATVGVFEDGVIKRIWGARGTVRMRAKVGETVVLSFEFTGADWEVVDGPLLSGVTYDTTEAPVFMDAGLTLDGGGSAVLTQLDFDLANTIALRQDVNAASGHLAARITGRKPTVTIDPEMLKVAEHDFFGKWRAGSLMALAASLGSTAGNTIAISAPKIQYQRLTTNSRDGVAALSAQAMCCKDAGDDEFVLTIT